MKISDVLRVQKEVERVYHEHNVILNSFGGKINVVDRGEFDQVPGCERLVFRDDCVYPYELQKYHAGYVFVSLLTWEESAQILEREGKANVNTEFTASPR